MVKRKSKPTCIDVDKNKKNILIWIFKSHMHPSLQAMRKRSKAFHKHNSQNYILGKDLDPHKSKP